MPPLPPELARQLADKIRERLRFEIVIEATAATRMDDAGVEKSLVACAESCVRICSDGPIPRVTVTRK